jgi:hypothetical protein
MRFIYTDPKTGLPDIHRFNLVQDRWERMIRRRWDGWLILWWDSLKPWTRRRIEAGSYVTLILLLLALL